MGQNNFMGDRTKRHPSTIHKKIVPSWLEIHFSSSQRGKVTRTYSSTLKCTQLQQNLQHKLKRVLNRLLQLTHKLATNGTVNNLVVKASGDDNLVVPLNACGAILRGLAGYGNLPGGANGDNTGLRGVDDGGKSLDGTPQA